VSRAIFFTLHPASYRKSSGPKPSWRRIARNVPDAISPLPVGIIANRPLAPLYSSFTEGFDTADLKEGKHCSTNWHQMPRL
jgi:hypothetical protein